MDAPMHDACHARNSQLAAKAVKQPQTAGPIGRGYRASGLNRISPHSTMIRHGVIASATKGLAFAQSCDISALLSRA